MCAGEHVDTSQGQAGYDDAEVARVDTSLSVGTLLADGERVAPTGAGSPLPPASSGGEAPLDRGGTGSAQGSLWDGFSRVLSCSNLHECIYAIPHADEVPPTLVIRSDDVGRYFVYSRPRHTPKPPCQTGKVRCSDALSSKAARVIQGAALKAVQLNRPLRAMWTLSIATPYLDDFLPADGFDGVQKPLKSLSGEFRRLWQWVTDYCRRNGLQRPVYVYSAESKSDGVRDYHPHLHVLTDLLFRREDFVLFAEAIEHAWGIGSVHMEVIRNPRKSASYLLKAVSYSVKGYESGQGRVWGQRWSVSKEIRPVEVRRPREDGSACWELEEVAMLLRESGVDKVKTPFGSVTVRGYYPSREFDAESVWLACAYARAELGVFEPF